MTATKPVKVEETLKDLKRLHELWINFRRYFLKAFSTEPISREEEHEFLEIKSEIARYQRVVSEEVGEDLYFAGDKIIELLRKSISIAHLRSLPLVDKQLNYKLWHYIFIYLGRTVGAYEFFTTGYPRPKRSLKREGAMTVSKVKAMASHGSEIFLKGKKREKIPAGKVFGVLLLLIIIGIAILLFTQR